jgi:hypothetical protein
MQVQLQWRVLSWALAFTLLFGVGCNKKKPSVPPVQAQAPTIQQPVPEQIPPANTTTTTPPESTTSTTASANPPEKPSPSTPTKSTTGSTHRHHPSTTAKKPSPAAPAPSTPPANETVAKASVPAPEVAVGQISPDMSKSAASQAQQSTAELLDSTEKNLRNLTRSLSSDEKNTVTQIRSYVTQAKLALKDQDLERAHNLALKAHQLSDVLVKQ